MQRFLDDLNKMPEVYFVSNWEAIQWMQSPTPINQLSQFEPWKCKTQVCLHPHTVIIEKIF